MKNKYLRMEKKERKETILEYKKDAKNLYVLKKLKRLEVIGYIGVIYSIIVAIFDYLNYKEVISFGFNTFGHNIYLNLIMDACLLIFSVLFIMKARKVKIRELNNFLINKK